MIVLSPLEYELRHLLNKVSQENDSNTPDYITAQYLIGALDAFNAAVRLREKHYGRPIITVGESRIAAIERLGGYTDADIMNKGGIQYMGEFNVVLLDTESEATTPTGIDEGDEHVAN